MAIDIVAVGDRLLLTRQSRKLSQQAFATSIDSSLRAYQSYERGERELPASVLVQLYKQHSIEPLWLLTGETGQHLDTAALCVILEMTYDANAIRNRSMNHATMAKVVTRAYQEHQRRPGPGEADEFRRLVELITTIDE